ncbi:LysR family transcriptional regulator [Cellulomonas sp. PhB150]|uniref:LysR family transcriptional regulator n=1 Tax=Cellulomonas sp. PhB150 TaxID=2485188 RepID=UPI000F49F829|nr:LysR family transcriptional regulator [Cellulomonas sp. PhB150]ROS27987.1 DNA-binding transcriptional LysR family regulator [Cellulomonas sp. PhB150]
MDLDLRLVRYFVVLADELHFGRAAARLHISQPALSQQIRKLEDSVGTKLLLRDSRHVTLTPRGERFLDDGRQLLAIAERMRQEPAANTVRIAHIFELSTSRVVADAFAAAHPTVQLVERSMDSARQLDALLGDRLDVAILRVTPRMLADHPTGWHHRPLRLEPMSLVGRPDDPPRSTVSLGDRALDVFADSSGSGLYNAHGEYLSAFERAAGLSLRWLGNPGTFNNCLSIWTRAPGPTYLFEFDSYARRYADLGLPVYAPAELSPVYPWSIAWRHEQPSQPTADFIRTAQAVARRNGWDVPPAGGAPVWVPPDEATG